MKFGKLASRQSCQNRLNIANKGIALERLRLGGATRMCALACHVITHLPVDSVDSARTGECRGQLSSRTTITSVTGHATLCLGKRHCGLDGNASSPHTLRIDASVGPPAEGASGPKFLTPALRAMFFQKFLFAGDQPRGGSS